jgi:hypothetical protein
MLLNQHVLVIPGGADVPAFVLSGGNVKEPPKPADTPPADETPVPGSTTLEQLRNRYLETLEVGSVEVNTLDTIRTHLAHFVRTLARVYRVQKNRSLTLTSI